MGKKLELTESQEWIVLRAMHGFTSDANLQKLQIEFPQMDFDALSDDIEEILEQLGVEPLEDEEEHDS